MADAAHMTRWRVVEDAEAVAREAAARILGAAAQALAGRGTFRMVLAGGRTPAQAYRLLAGARTDWSHWQIYFGDERCLPADDPERNSVMADGAWLEQVSIPRENVHPIPAELGAEAAARVYEPVVQEALPFDLVILGMGEDGHTASLFPGHSQAGDALVLAVHGAPKPPSDRVSLSARALSDAQEVLVLVTGAAKRDALRRWLKGEDLPIARVVGHTGAELLLDREAAS